MGRDHVADLERIHHAWDMSLEPALAIESGDTVQFDIQMSGAGQVFEGAPFDEVQFDLDTTGPPKPASAQFWAAAWRSRSSPSSERWVPVPTSRASICRFRP